MTSFPVQWPYFAASWRRNVIFSHKNTLILKRRALKAIPPCSGRIRKTLWAFESHSNLLKTSFQMIFKAETKMEKHTTTLAFCVPLIWPICDFWEAWDIPWRPKIELCHWFCEKTCLTSVTGQFYNICSNQDFLVEERHELIQYVDLRGIAGWSSSLCVGVCCIDDNCWKNTFILNGKVLVYAFILALKLWQFTIELSLLYTNQFPSKFTHFFHYIYISLKIISNVGHSSLNVFWNVLL